MKKFFASLTALVLMLGLSASAGTWNVDAVHSSVSFSVRHMVIAKTTGKFTDFSGTAEFDGTTLADGTVEFTIQVASINTEDEGRDKHLRSGDFFDVENFPTMSFKSKKVVVGAGGKFQLVGDLTIKDVTREVTFDSEFYGSMTDPWGNNRAGFSAKTTLDRQEFNITWSKNLDTGGLVVGNNVEVTIELELVQKAEKTDSN